MKKLYILILFAVLPNLIFAQQAVFDKFDGMDNVKSVLVTKKMFQMMGNVKMDPNDKEMQKYISLTKKLDNLKQFSTSNPKIKADLKATADKYIVAAGLEELMRVKDGTQNIRILVKSAGTKSQIKELLMYIEDSGPSNETILMSLTGNFDLNELSVLTDKMNLPGGNVLNKTAK
ncbi:DUF4252 domain-containing protein [Flavobacterium tegetincola]|uniref:DUF4252 domain-containing protein n=1 Tax=Flavobacterium tegetincola TaxID=150172 RepID=UPI000409CB53|nr:DUF4252 domain-containing protein [Flavobacterium tegetincola]